MRTDTLYVTDLDGTLLGMEHRLTEETVVLLKGQLEKGVKFLVATARNYASASKLLEPIGYKGDLILLNGSLITDYKGQVLWSANIEGALVERIRTALSDFDGHLVWSSVTNGNHIELPENPDQMVLAFVEYRKKGGFRAFEQWKGKEPLYAQRLITATAMVSADQAQICLKRLGEAGLLSDLVAHAMPYPGIGGLTTLTIHLKGVNKGAGLRQLLHIKEQEYKRIVAFGDQLNDIELFQGADEAYAVLEAHSELKAIATGVIGSNQDSAVARWISRDGEVKKRIDERDIMFARQRYQEGSDAHSDYYTRHPEKRDLDEQVKLMPHIFGHGTATYHPYLSPFGDAGFEVISGLKQQAETLQGPRGGRLLVDGEAMAKQIVDFARYLGCDDVALVPIEDEDLYSHKGRENYGREIANTYKNGLVLVKAMDKGLINRAPQLEACFTVVKAYLDLANVGLWLAKYIEHLGYGATAHIDGNYEAFLPAIAEKAGLGEMGRANLLIHPKFGMSLRLAMVTTDLPLKIENEPRRAYKIKDFCAVCQRCATTCPGKAISAEAAIYDEDLMVAAWPFAQESCYAVWRRLGTDCGVCLSSCPWTQGFTDEELVLLESVGVQAAFEAYKERQPLRQYIRNPLDWVSYPAPPKMEI